jgi:hypothetical protein
MSQLIVYRLQDLRNVNRDMKIIISSRTISIMGFELMCELYLDNATPTYHEGTE